MLVAPASSTARMCERCPESGSAGRHAEAWGDAVAALAFAMPLGSTGRPISAGPVLLGDASLPGPRSGRAVFDLRLETRPMKRRHFLAAALAAGPVVAGDDPSPSGRTRQWVSRPAATDSEK